MAKEATGILTIVCPDRPGLVAAVSGFIAGHNGNILDAQQFADRLERTFYMRVEFDPGEMDLTRRDISGAFGEVAKQFSMTWRLRFSDEVPVMGIMVSQQEHCLMDLLSRYRMGELPVRIPIVLGNHPDLEPAAAAFGVPFLTIPITPQNRERAEAQQLSALGEAGCDFVVLARYMQILSPFFLDAYSGAVINIHHGFLPAFAGARPYHQAHARGVKLIGATSHYATEVLDDGPIIDQDVIRVTHRDTPADLTRKGRDIERTVLARAVRAHAEDRVVVHGRRTVVFD